MLGAIGRGAINVGGYGAAAMYQMGTGKYGMGPMGAMYGAWAGGAYSAATNGLTNFSAMGAYATAGMGMGYAVGNPRRAKRRAMSFAAPAIRKLSVNRGYNRVASSLGYRSMWKEMRR